MIKISEALSKLVEIFPADMNDDVDNPGFLFQTG